MIVVISDHTHLLFSVHIFTVELYNSTVPAEFCTLLSQGPCPEVQTKFSKMCTTEREGKECHIEEVFRDSKYVLELFPQPNRYVRFQVFFRI